VRGSDALPPADFVVAADVLYEAPLASAIARRVIEARARKSRVVVGDPGRIFRALFAKLVAERGIDAPFAASGDVDVVVI
jgi:predicted nicotinamide N-methyase